MEYSYRYTSTEGWNLQYFQGKLLAHFSLEPANPDWFAGMSMNEDEVIVHTSRALEMQEKSTLDVFMATADGLAPEVAGYSKVTIPNFIQHWKSIQTASGLTVNFAFSNESTGNFELWILGELSANQKQQLINALKDQITITKY